MFQIIRILRRFSPIKRYYSAGSDKDGVDIDDPDGIETMENNYNEMYLQLHQSNVATTTKIQDFIENKEYRTIGEYAETMQKSLSYHLTSNQRHSKPQLDNQSTAVGRIFLGRENMLSLLEERENKASSILTVAEVAGIMAAKKTRELIPNSYYSHVQKVDISVTLSLETSEVLVASSVSGAEGDTSSGAVLACSLALVSIFDHFKNNKDVHIGPIHLQS